MRQLSILGNAQNATVAGDGEGVGAGFADDSQWPPQPHAPDGFELLYPDPGRFAPSTRAEVSAYQSRQPGSRLAAGARAWPVCSRNHDERSGRSHRCERWRARGERAEPTRPGVSLKAGDSPAGGFAPVSGLPPVPSDFVSAFAPTPGGLVPSLRLTANAFSVLGFAYVRLREPVIACGVARA